jgi:hypothetical protein
VHGEELIELATVRSRVKRISKEASTEWAAYTPFPETGCEPSCSVTAAVPIGRGDHTRRALAPAAAIPADGYRRGRLFVST